MNGHDALFFAYARAFEQGDVDALMARFHFPFTVQRDGQRIPVAEPAAWRANLEALLARYARYQASAWSHRIVAEHPLAGGHCAVQLAWRGADAAGEERLAFATTYILNGEGRIAGLIVRDEAAAWARAEARLAQDALAREAP